METIEAQVQYVVTPGEVMHRALVVDGIRYTAEACNLDDANLARPLPDDPARPCERCMPAEPRGHDAFTEPDEETE